MVKCVEIDSQGRVNLSRKATLPGNENMEYKRPSRPSRPSHGGGRNDHHGPRR